MATASLTPTFLGRVGDTGVFRIDLSQSGLADIQAITVADDNIISGGSGSVSGFDLDFVKLSATSTDEASAVASLLSETAFNFGQTGVVFHPGFLQTWVEGDNPAWNKPYLSGTNANAYDPAKATLSVLDGSSAQDTGSISLGEGGTLTFLLTHAVSTGAKYLYFGERGGGNDQVNVAVTVSNDTPGGGGGGGGGNPIPADPGVAGIHLVGTPRKDVIMLGEGLNQHLGAGNDTIEGLAGNDRLGGAGGNDWLFGGKGHDKLYGGEGDDWLYGGKGNDSISGGGGNDRIFGGPGKDKLYGRAGEDAFVFTTRPGASNLDKIADFKVKDDSVWLENKVFKALGKAGSLADPAQLKAQFFWKGEAAHDADDHVIYNQKTGALYYDADGTGAAQQVQIAQLSKHLKMTFKDFFVV